MSPVVLLPSDDIASIKDSLFKIFLFSSIAFWAMDLRSSEYPCPNSLKRKDSASMLSGLSSRDLSVEAIA